MNGNENVVNTGAGGSLGNSDPAERSALRLSDAELARLRHLAITATPGPIVLATSNSWRRFEARRSGEVCTPTKQSDGHPDLHFPNGGSGGPDATLMVEAYNALPALLDHIDAQAAEIDGLQAELEHRSAYWITHRGAALACSSVMRDAYSDEKVREDSAEADDYGRRKWHDYAELRVALGNVEFHDDGHTQRQTYDPKEWEFAANPETIRALLAERDALRAALEGAWTLIAQLPPTQDRVEVAQMVCVALAQEQA